MARHVVLVGLMGSGKTTVGRRLAARLDRHFVDADAAIEEITDRTIAEIFEQEGEQGFRDLEADTFEELFEVLVGRLLGYGAAPYQFRASEDASFYVRLQTQRGEVRRIQQIQDADRLQNSRLDGVRVDRAVEHGSDARPVARSGA